MWTLLLIVAVIALWFSPSLRRSLARLIDPDDRHPVGEAAPAPERGSSE
jgi:hypothetical protein